MNSGYDKRLIVYKESRLKSDMELFNYILSHDLKKPLRMLSNSCNEIKDEHYQDLNDKCKHVLEVAYSTVHDMQIMLDAMLEYIRLEAFPPELKPVNCNDIITNIVNNDEQLVKRNNVKVSFNNLPTVLGYKKHVTYLFSQLIDNAIKFKKEHTDLEIFINYIQENGFYRFEVIDNGIGIEEEYYEVIFLLFQRLHTKEEIDGHGVGLAICKKVVESCGGEMWVESENRVGSKFVFTLPFITCDL
jgi:light-regulated signal transduction histidine kinase (bacteriophytochrome)